MKSFDKKKLYVSTYILQYAVTSRNSLKTLQAHFLDVKHVRRVLTI